MNRVNFNIYRISLIMNNKCNMTCSHCFQHSEFRHNYELQVSDVDKFIDFVLNHKHEEKLELTIIGGEPTLFSNYNSITKSLDKLVQNGILFSTVRLFTNGYIINNDLNNLLSHIKQYSDNIDIWITKDLDPEYSDRSINGKSINLYVDQNSIHYKKLGFNVFYQCVMSKSNVYRFSYILNNIYHDKTLSLELCYPCKPNNDFDEIDFEYMVRAFLDFISNHDVDHDFIYRSNMWNGIVSSNYNRLHYPTCDPIKGELSISPKGFIIPCVKCLDIEDQFSKYHISDKRIDELLSDDFIDKFISYDDVSESGTKCRDCVLKEVCVPCRLTLDLVDLNEEHIYHSKHKCDRIHNFYKIKCELIGEYLRNGGKNIWQMN